MHWFLRVERCVHRAALCLASWLAAHTLSALPHECPALLRVQEATGPQAALHRLWRVSPDAFRSSVVMPIWRWAQALAAALVILFVLYLRRRYTINPASVYRCALLQGASMVCRRNQSAPVVQESPRCSRACEQSFAGKELCIIEGVAPTSRVAPL